MRRILTTMLLAAVLCVVGTQAQAASGLDLLYLDGNTVNFLEDDDWEIVVKGEGNRDVTELEIGDLVIGMFRITGSKDVSPATRPDKDAFTNGATLTGIFVTEYAGTTDVDVYPAIPAFSDTIELGKFIPYDGSWSTLFGSKIPLVGLEALGLPEPTADGTIAIIYSDDDIPAVAGGNQDFIDQGSNPPGVVTSLSQAFDTASDGTVLWEIGFAGWNTVTDVTSNPNEWWYSNGDTGVPPSSVEFFTSLNVTANLGAPALLPHSWLFTGANVNSIGLAATSAVQAGGGRSTADAGLFLLSTDTDFYIKPTPEPGTLALLGLGLVGIGGVVYRRRRNK